MHLNSLNIESDKNGLEGKGHKRDLKILFAKIQDPGPMGSENQFGAGLRVQESEAISSSFSAV